jgi:hypothetical protein
MSDQSMQIGNIAKQIFSPPVLAAARNVLGALGLLLGMIGIGVLSPEKVNRVMEVASQLGTVITAFVALLGLLSPLAAGAWAAWTATQPQQIKTVAAIASDPTQAQSAPAQQALVEATSAIAANNILEKSPEAKQTLIAATIALPEVQTIVTDKATANAQPSSSVVAAEEFTPT